MSSPVLTVKLPWFVSLLLLIALSPPLIVLALIVAGLLLLAALACPFVIGTMWVLDKLDERDRARRRKQIRPWHEHPDVMKVAQRQRTL